MLTRLAQPEDLQLIRSLYDQIFHDDQDFTDRFFAEVYRAKNTCVVVVNSIIVASAQVIEFNALGLGSGGEEMCHAGYVYAVMTHPDYRNRGCMTAMMDFMINKYRKFDFLFLIPQNNFLYDIYAKYGFRKFTFRSVNKTFWDTELFIDAVGDSFRGMFLPLSEQACVEMLHEDLGVTVSFGK